MAEYRNNNYSDNINCDNNINNNYIKKKSITCGNFKVQEKTFKYCWKCGKELEELSIDMFCDFSCRSEYYKELVADMDDIVGIN